MPQKTVPAIGADVSALMPAASVGPALGTDVSALMGAGHRPSAPPPAWNQLGGDIVLDNLRNAIPALANLARGAGKELAAQGIRGGALLRKIPGVNELSERLPSVNVNTQPTGPAESAGALGLAVGEFLGAGGAVKAAATTLGKAGAGAMLNAGLAGLQGASPAGTVAAGAVGGFAPYVSQALAAGTTATANKIETVALKPSRADWANGFRAANVFKHDVGGSLGATIEKTGQRLGQFGTRLKALLTSQPTGPVDLNQAYSNVVAQYLNNPEATKAADFVLKAIEFDLNARGVPLSPLLDVADAQIAKQAVGELGAWIDGQAGTVKDLHPAVIERVANTFYDALKTGIEANVKGPVAELNHAMSEIIPIRTAAIRRMPVAARNHVLSFPEVVSLVTGHAPMAAGYRALGTPQAADALARLGQHFSSGGPQLGGQLAAAAATQAAK